MRASHQTRVGQGCRRSRQGKKNFSEVPSEQRAKSFAQPLESASARKLKPFMRGVGARPVPLQECRMVISLLLETLHCGLSAWGRPAELRVCRDLMAMGTAVAG